MSISIQIFLPKFSQKTIENTVADLASHRLKFDFDEDDRTSDPSLWSGFRPVAVTISDLERSTLISEKFETGFEIDVETFNAKDYDFGTSGEQTDITEKLKSCETVVTITVAPDMPAPLAIANCFAAALAEAGGGLAFDCESGEFAREMQSLSSMLTSDYVDEFDFL